MKMPMKNYDQMSDGAIYAAVSSRLAMEDETNQWQRAPWYARAIGYKWRRWRHMNLESYWEYQTDKQRAREALHEQFAPRDDMPMRSRTIARRGRG